MWARFVIVDAWGGAGVFTAEHTQIETGKMYIFLISKNRVARYMEVSEFEPAAEDDFTKFIVAESFPDVPDGMHRVVAFSPRTTKAGKRMAEMVVSDEHKNLTSVLVFPQMFMRGYANCREGKVVDIVLKETQDGALFLENVL